LAATPPGYHRGIEPTFRIRRAAYLGIAALVALTATVFGVVNAVRTPLTARESTQSQLHPTYFGGPSSHEKAACRVEEASLGTYLLSDKTLQKALFIQNSITAANPKTLEAFPPQPASGYWQMWKNTYFYANMSVNAVDLDSRSATVGFGISLGTDVRGEGSGPLLPSDATFALDVLTDGGLSSTVLSSTADQINGLGVASLTLPLVGNPSAYPFDTYQAEILDIFVVVTVPGHGFSDFEADVVNVFSAQSVQDRVVAKSGSNLMFSDHSSCRVPLALVVQRSIGRLQIWLLLMALLPLAFVPLIYLAARRRGIADGAALAALAVGLVAILPLRSVLVPPTVPAPTTIDFLLGADMTTLIMVLVLGSLISFIREHPDSPQTRS
jgi:hypothetical protein